MSARTHTHHSCSRNGRNHCRLGVTAQTLLEKPGEDRVSVRDKLALGPLLALVLTGCRQSGDDFAESGEGPVDIGTFFESRALRC